MPWWFFKSLAALPSSGSHFPYNHPTLGSYCPVGGKQNSNRTWNSPRSPLLTVHYRHCYLATHWCFKVAHFCFLPGATKSASWGCSTLGGCPFADFCPLFLSVDVTLTPGSWPWALLLHSELKCLDQSHCKTEDFEMDITGHLWPDLRKLNIIVQ